MHERTLALITHLLGESCVLCHFSSMVKGPGKDHLPLHADQNQSGGPAPFPPYAQIANATWALTDYTVSNGCICFSPGSHKLCRHPTYKEATDLARFVPLEVPAGSVIIWHGNTWHGALRRTNRGVRVSLLAFFNRWYHLPLEQIRSRITQEMLDRNSPRFAVLIGSQRPVLEEPESSQAKATRTSLLPDDARQWRSLSHVIG
jgi:ectoine hydroxylase-related dioxygenase (phytanoyl-CoA dioxygenase family)